MFKAGGRRKEGRKEGRELSDCRVLKKSQKQIREDLCLALKINIVANFGTR
jgi:hypothetical protein